MQPKAPTKTAMTHRSLPYQCPACQSAATVEGRIMNPTFDDDNAGRFYPQGIQWLTLTRSVKLIHKEHFRACTQCGHVWGKLDATDLRELIESKGTPELQQKLSKRPGSAKV